MKYILAIIISFSLSSLCAQHFSLSISESHLEWAGYGEIGNFTQQGTIRAKSGSLITESEQITAGEVIIDMTTIEHEDKNLKDHLKKKDFFHVKKHPTAQIELISIDKGILNANLTIKGITQAIQATFDISMVEDKLLINGTATIDRTLFDIKYNSSTYFQDLGNYAIKNEFDLKFDLVFIKG